METNQPIRTRFTVRNHSRLAYEPRQAGSATQVRPVVLLHDLLSERAVFQELAAHLRRDAPVVIPDARGHGASATLVNQWYTVAELALDLVAVLDAETIPCAHLVGHGLGGAIALELALRVPERVASLTLIAPACYSLLDHDRDPRALHAREDRRASDRAAADAAYKGLIDRALDAYLVPRHGVDWREAAGKRRVAVIRRHAAALAALLPALDGFAPLKSELHRLPVRAMLIASECASEIDALVFDRLRDALPSERTQAVLIPREEAELLQGEAAGTLADLIRQQLVREP